MKVIAIGKSLSGEAIIRLSVAMDADIEVRATVENQFDAFAVAHERGAEAIILPKNLLTSGQYMGDIRLGEPPLWLVYDDVTEQWGSIITLARESHPFIGDSRGPIMPPPPIRMADDQTR